MRLLIGLLGLCWMSIALAQCEDEGIDYNQAVMFVKQIQTAVKQSDARALSTKMEYPLRTPKGQIKSANEFIKRYSTIVTSDIKQRILKADPNDVFCNYQGGMVGDGIIWFIGEPLKIITINDTK